MISLGGCGQGGSESAPSTCPAVVEYDAGSQKPAAAELDLLPDRSTIAEMLADYTVMRRQAKDCASLEEP